MKTTQEMIEVMQAFEEGGELQCYEPELKEWIGCTPAWDWLHYDYRIKPEPKEPTYRPYESVAELVEDFEKRFQPKPYSQRPMYTMPLIWVRHKDYTKSVGLYDLYVDTKVALKCDFNRFEYLDGTPFGKLVEEC